VPELGTETGPGQPPRGTALAYGRATRGLRGARGELRPGERLGGVQAQAVAPGVPIHRSAWKGYSPKLA
jgi:hypothetical protein